MPSTIKLHARKWTKFKMIYPALFKSPLSKILWQLWYVMLTFTGSKIISNWLLLLYYIKDDLKMILKFNEAHEPLHELFQASELVPGSYMNHSRLLNEFLVATWFSRFTTLYGSGTLKEVRFTTLHQQSSNMWLHITNIVTCKLLWCNVIMYVATRMHHIEISKPYHMLAKTHSQLPKMTFPFPRQGVLA